MKSELPDPQPGEVWRLTGINRDSGLMDLDFLHDAFVLVDGREAEKAARCRARQVYFRILHAPNWKPPHVLASAHPCWFACRLDTGIAALYGVDV